MASNRLPDDIEDDVDIPMEIGFSNVVIIDHMPIVPPEKVQKLQAIILKIFAKAGPFREDGFYMPFDTTKNETLGFAFLEYTDPKSASKAVETLNRTKLDKQHILLVNYYEDLKKYESIPDEYVAPQAKEHEERDLTWWLYDKNHLTDDQYIFRQGDETEIYWNKPKKPVLIYKKKNWTDSYLMWSPLGTYLATLRIQGITLWGGPNWQKISNFQHPGVKLIDFSPKEQYLISFSPPSRELDKNQECLIIWDIKSEKKLRGFPGDSTGWPVFKWSFDGKYFARISQDQISVYEAPAMTLLDKKSIKIPNVKDFCWSPTQHIISCYVPESGNNPARVVLYEIPSKKELRTTNVFNVKDCKMHWQDKGEYLCLKIDRFTKTKKSTSPYFEIFFMKEKGFPVQGLEVKNKIVAFAWEPKGTRFVFIHSNETSPRTDISFYALEGGKIVHLKTLEKKQANHLFWSPRGDHIVLAGLKGPYNGALEFFSVSKLETLSTNEHYAASEIEWDPSGRYVVTSSSSWSPTQYSSDSGYNMWTFYGKLLSKNMIEKFNQFMWRPRPPSLLTEEQEKEIKNNFRTISAKYKAEESKRRDEALKERRLLRQKQKKDFEEYIARKKKELEEEQKRRDREEEPKLYSIRRFERVLEVITEKLD